MRKQRRDDQLKLFFLDKCETPKTSAKFSIEIPEEPFSGKVLLHLSRIVPEKVTWEVRKVMAERIIEPSFLFDYYEESDEEELETFLLCIR